MSKQYIYELQEKVRQARIASRNIDAYRREKNTGIGLLIGSGVAIILFYFLYSFGLGSAVKTASTVDNALPATVLGSIWIVIVGFLFVVASIPLSIVGTIKTIRGSIRYLRAKNLTIKLVDLEKELAKAKQEETIEAKAQVIND